MSQIKIINVAFRRCVGCRLCEQWCSYSHDGKANPAMARIKVLRDLESSGDIPMVCHQCATPLCLNKCPAGALYRDNKTGAIRLDRGACLGCGLCVEACPHGGVGVDSGGYPLICDLCDGKPQCVTHCPVGALSFLRRDLVDRVVKADVARKSGGEGY